MTIKTIALGLASAGALAAGSAHAKWIPELPHMLDRCVENVTAAYPGTVMGSDTRCRSPGPAPGVSGIEKMRRSSTRAHSPKLARPVPSDRKTRYKGGPADCACAGVAATAQASKPTAIETRMRLSA